MTGMFNRLQWRVFVFLAVSLMTLLGLFSFAYNRVFTRQVMSEAATHSALVADTIHLGLAQSMMSKNREGIQLSLRDISNNPEILEVFVTDRDGKIVFSSEPSLDGKNIQHTDFAGMEGSAGWKIAEDEDPSRLYRYMPIPNREPCQECHAAAKAYLGAIAIGLSLDGPVRLIQTNRYLFLAMVSLVLILLFVVNAHFFSRNVTRPVERLMQRFRQIGEGNLQASQAVEPVRDDELGVLTVKFEELVATIMDLHQREKEKEKERALLQRERDHQEELEQVNRQLSERLRILTWQTAGSKPLRASWRIRTKACRTRSRISRLSTE